MLVAREPESSRASGLLAALALAAVASAIQWIACTFGPWFAAHTTLPTCLAGQLVEGSSLGYLVYATGLLALLGFCAGRAWLAFGGADARVAMSLGVLAAIAIAVFFAWRALGLAGTIVAASVVALVAATLTFGTNPEVRKSSERNRDSWCAAIALGIACGAIDPAVEQAGGGTFAAALVVVAIVAVGAALGGASRVIFRTQSGWFMATCAIVLAFATWRTGLTPIVIDRLVRESASVAAGSGGLLPPTEWLAPAPQWIIVAAIAAVCSGAFSSPHGVGAALVAAMIARITPRGEGTLAVLSMAAGLVALGAIGEALAATSNARRRRLAHGFALIASSCGIGYAMVNVGSIVDGRDHERDGAAVGFELDRQLDPQALPTNTGTIDGLAMPLRRAGDEVAKRLVANCVALSDPPQRCLVLGPGGSEWVAAWLATTQCDVDYVTPSRADASLVRATCVGSQRARVFVIAPRRYLAATFDEYDRIFVCPPEPPWHLAGSTRTREFRDLAVARLSGEGIVAESFLLTTMQPANLVFRVLADVALEREDGLLLLDHPLSGAPAFAFAYGRTPLRFDVETLERRANPYRDAAAATTSWSAARSLLGCVFADTDVLRFAFALLSTNRDDRPWLAASMHALVIPDDRYVTENLSKLLGCHVPITSRIDGPLRDRLAFFSDLRRDHEAAHYWLLRRSSPDAAFASDPEHGLETTQEIDLLELCLQKSPDAPFLRSVLASTAARLERTQQRRRGRELLQRASLIEARFRERDGVFAASPRSHDLALEWAIALARHGRRSEALAALSALEAEPIVRRKARLEMARLLASSGRAERARAVEIAAELRRETAEDGESATTGESVLSPNDVTDGVNGGFNAAARMAAYPRRAVRR